MFPNVCFLISQRWKKISTNGFHHCILHPCKNLSLEHERNRTNLWSWKMVANESCTAEIGEMSSVKILFWANHTTKKPQNSLKRKIFGSNNVPEKVNWFYGVIFEKWGRNGQKRPNQPKIVKIAVFRLLVNESPNENDRNTSNWDLVFRRNENK